MKHRMKVAVVLALLAVQSIAGAVEVAAPEVEAGPRQRADASSYRFAWPVTVSGTDSLHQFRLPVDLYPVLFRDDLGDLELIDEQGYSVPLATLPEAPLRPWLQLPTPMSIVHQSAQALAEGEPYPSERARIRIVVQTRQTDVLPIRALRIIYEHHRELPADASFRIRQATGAESQADEGPWVHLKEVASRFDLASHSGEVRLVLEPVRTREIELMLSPVPASVTVRVVMAEYDWEEPTPVRWQTAELLPMKSPQAQQSYFEFASGGPAPWHRLRLGLGKDVVGKAQVLALTTDGYWQGIGGLTAYDIALDDARFARDQIAFDEQRARRFRVQIDPPPQHPPEISLAYRPDLNVFSQRGPARLTLLAGSEKHVRAIYPVREMVEDVRNQLGADWHPADATVGSRVEWTGTLAFKPVEKPAPKEDYKPWLLWSLLMIAAVLVGWMALKMTREPPA